MQATSYSLPQARPIYHKPDACLTPAEKARTMTAEGYRISECIFAHGVYLVHKPGTQNYMGYRVDLRGSEPTCDCWDSRKRHRACKHICFTRNYLANAATLPNEKTQMLQNRIAGMLAQCEGQGQTLERLAAGAAAVRMEAAGGVSN